jgi:hypothetical protein
MTEYEHVDISKERMVQNCADILDAIPFIDPLQLATTGIGFTTTCVVAWLNNNGFELAAQALDDQWYDREDQWWREPDGFDTHYKNGE